MRFEPQSRREPSIRLFRAPALELLTHVHPAVVVVVWAPVIGWLLWRAAHDTALSASAVVAGVALGLLVWTLAEYLLHRFVFHFAPRDPPPWLERLLFLFHGIHHVQPWDPTRLVMPPSASIPLAALHYLLFAWVLGPLLGAPAWVAPVFAGFLAGYVAYDLLHYALHHLPASGPVLKELKRHHALHHYATPGLRFGVSSPLWDHVFGTLPGREERGSPARPPAPAESEDPVAARRSASEAVR